MTRAAKMIVIEVLGWLLVLAGIAALVLPGPGLLMIFAGVALLSQRYAWAERRLAPIKYRALKGAADSVDNKLRVAGSVVLAIWLLAWGVVWIWSPPAPSWWPVADSWWLIGGAGTGVTLILSGLLAIFLIVWSIRKFRGHPEALEAVEAEYAEHKRRS
ncbi:PGPGW domain-containing protein [Nocardioides bruguierae]|uniref:PGPGW domain-containing protein n=1 Tax=Nocardioides bruguierae TaxID=2945102 RepID=UPI002021F878|nr:PGPGW domain-containing protein [Nocardioides bruguierae]MCL8025432.1 PGPGW domain-containing protein [Nocardioides bruguierae]